MKQDVLFVDSLLNKNLYQSIALPRAESHRGEVRVAFRRYVVGLSAAIVLGARSRQPSLL